jgi:hypothetical protein
MSQSCVAKKPSVLTLLEVTNASVVLVMSGTARDA